MVRESENHSSSPSLKGNISIKGLQRTVFKPTIIVIVLYDRLKCVFRFFSFIKLFRWIFQKESLRINVCRFVQYHNRNVHIHTQKI
mmetsp:Transcript_52446/g.63189  ORF Transcript_52446/g.63189 Transcript_52446/m.63189 type:complete len:86 (-) Transcript_52446:95-352(-)